jgi:subtilisin family serine protease
MSPRVQREIIEVTSEDPLVRGRTGRGVRVAVIDSGVNAGHPHLGPLADAVTFTEAGVESDGAVDRLGHGTAVTAAIHEKAPGAEIHVVKVFEDTLSTNLDTLIRAIDWTADRGIHLINLSLGTANPENSTALEDAVARLREQGGLLVSAARGAGRAWYPGVLPGVLGVELDPGCPREHVRFAASGRLCAYGSGFARPIPGVPPERNLNGVSFAVANVTGMLARALEGRVAGTGVPPLRMLLGFPEEEGIEG